MKWKKVKDQVAREVYTMIIEGRSMETMATILVDFVITGTRPPGASLVCSRSSFKAYAAKAWEVIQNWDIRSASRLRDLFPGTFPRSLSKGNLKAFYDDQGDWSIEAI